jgi:hypothetical protein
MEQELEALQRLDEGKNMQNKTEECGIGHVTAGDWKRKKSDTEKWCSARASISCNN